MQRFIPNPTPCRNSRRSFLWEVGGGFASLALVDLLSREASRGDQTVKLPAREADLLAFLMRRPGQVCSQPEILRAVWGFDHDPGTNLVPVYIGYLRRKLDAPGSPAPIETVRSAGYRLVDA